MTKDDLKGSIEHIPMGVVVRMLEEQELQGNKPDVKVFQKSMYEGAFSGGFDWIDTKAGIDFWRKVLRCKDFDLFFERYPEYERYNL